MDDADYPNPARDKPEEPVPESLPVGPGQAAKPAPNSVVNTGAPPKRKTPKQPSKRLRSVSAGIDPSLALQMKGALTAPALPAELDLVKKPTARAIVVSLRPELGALRAGTAPVCNGRQMSWREIGFRLAQLTDLSEDSLRKAWATETSTCARSPRVVVSKTPGSGRANAKTSGPLEKSVASAAMIDQAVITFGPLFDDE